MEGRGGKGLHFFGLNVFFIVERLGVIFFTNSLWDEGKGAPGERVHQGKGCKLSFFLLFFIVEGEGGGG